VAHEARSSFVAVRRQPPTVDRILAATVDIESGRDGESTAAELSAGARP